MKHIAVIFACLAALTLFCQCSSYPSHPNNEMFDRSCSEFRIGNETFHKLGNGYKINPNGYPSLAKHPGLTISEFKSNQGEFYVRLYPRVKSSTFKKTQRFAFLFFQKDGQYQPSRIIQTDKDTTFVVVGKNGPYMSRDAITRLPDDWLVIVGVRDETGIVCWRKHRNGVAISTPNLAGAPENSFLRFEINEGEENALGPNDLKDID